MEKNSPQNDATLQPIDLTLQWDPSSQGSSYEVCYDQTPNSTCDLNNWLPVPAGTSYDLSGLTYGVTYYWQVRAKNGEDATTEANAGDWWHFTTMLQPPNTFSKTIPLIGAGLQPIELTLQWEGNTQGVTYEYCVSLIDGSCASPRDWVSTLNTSAAPEDLAYGTTYYWQVRAKNSEDTITEANSGNWWSFTTMLPPPVSFNKTSPSNGNNSQPVNPVLHWDPSDAGVTYEICVSSANNRCESTQGWVTTTDTSIVPTGLQYKTTYYWQVRVQNSQGTFTEANEGAWWSFTTYAEPPASFMKTSPDTNALNQTVSVWLTWSNAGPDFHYEYCLSKTLPLSCTLWNPVYESSIEVTGLDYLSTYHWQVRAVDDSGHMTYANAGDNDPIWHFSTRPAPPASSNKTIDPPVLEDQPVSDSLQGAGTPNWDFLLYGDPPAGTLDLQPDGNFTYTPVPDSNETITFQFTVTDHINPTSVPYTVTIPYLPVNDPPLLNKISLPSSVLSREPIGFIAAGTDVDLGDQLTFSAKDLPLGASINPTTGIFSWIPTYTKDGPNTYTFTILVSDGHSVPEGYTKHQQVITITVAPRMTFLPLIFH